MDRQEAKLLLQACRTNSGDVTLPAFTEALALAETDPELKAWWEAQQAFDRRVAAKMQEVAIPADLRSTILTGQKIEQVTPQPSLVSWLAIAAVVAILCVAGTFKEIAMTTGPLARTDYASIVLPLLHNNAPDLAMTTTDREKIVDWLKARNAPLGALPGGMTSLPPAGCQKYVVHGHTVSLICFTMADGKVAHLFIVERTAISDLQQNNVPEIKQMQGWSTASWSDDRMSYLLATQDSPEALKQLL